MAKVPNNCDVKVTWHARQRTTERFDGTVADQLADLARRAKRTKQKTRDGLRVWRATTSDAKTLVLLVLEKTASSLGGLYEAEVITVITPEMAERGIL